MISGDILEEPFPGKGGHHLRGDASGLAQVSEYPPHIARRRFSAPTLSPATLFYLSRGLYSGHFQRRDPNAFQQEKTGAAHPRGSQGASRRLGSAHGAEFGFLGAWIECFPTLGRNPPQRAAQGETGGAWVRAAGYKKAAAQFCRTAA